MWLFFVNVGSVGLHWAECMPPGATFTCDFFNFSRKFTRIHASPVQTSAQTGQVAISMCHFWQLAGTQVSRYQGPGLKLGQIRWGKHKSLSTMWSFHHHFVSSIEFSNFSCSYHKGNPVVGVNFPANISWIRNSLTSSSLASFQSKGGN